MNARPAIPVKVRALVPVLGSDIDGEALGACRAVGRVLRGVGLSYHDLAAAIPVREPEMRLGRAGAVRTAGPADFGDWRKAWSPFPASHRPPRSFTPKMEALHREQARYCRDHDRGRLSPRERAFVSDIAGLRRGLTIRQADWLGDITDRLEQEDRRA